MARVLPHPAAIGKGGTAGTAGAFTPHGDRTVDRVAAMSPRAPYRPPLGHGPLLARAARLEWISLGALLLVVGMMYLAMGQSQAMRTAWMEDMLSLVPPAAFLFALRVRDRPPDRLFPWGYHRATMLAFLVASVALLLLGLVLLGDAVLTLWRREHPQFGDFTLLGRTYPVWSGWVMMLALGLSVVPPMILGRLKAPLARRLYEKTLHADADMNKADWMTGLAGMAGVAGVGLGFWWADAAAAAVISLSVLRDGLTNLRRAATELMDRRPTEVESDRPLDLEGEITGLLRSAPGVSDVSVRLREEGNMVSGEVFVTLDEGEALARRLRAMARAATALDPRLHGIVIMPVPGSKK